MSQCCSSNMTSWEARVKLPDAVCNSDNLDKSDSALCSALLGKNKTQKTTYRRVKMENSFPSAHTTLVLSFIQATRLLVYSNAKFHVLLPGGKGQDIPCVEISQVCVCVCIDEHFQVLEWHSLLKLSKETSKWKSPLSQSPLEFHWRASFSWN